MPFSRAFSNASAASRNAKRPWIIKDVWSPSVSSARIAGANGPQREPRMVISSTTTEDRFRRAPEATVLLSTTTPRGLVFETAREKPSAEPVASTTTGHFSPSEHRACDRFAKHGNSQRGEQKPFFPGGGPAGQLLPRRRVAPGSARGPASRPRSPGLHAPRSRGTAQSPRNRRPEARRKRLPRLLPHREGCVGFDSADRCIPQKLPGGREYRERSSRGNAAPFRACTRRSFRIHNLSRPRPFAREADAPLAPPPRPRTHGQRRHGNSYTRE